MGDIAIRVEEIGKLYRIGKREKYKTLRDTLASAFTAPFRNAGKLLRGEWADPGESDPTIWALKDISFEVQRGEVIGVIGGNGAGKSTLLKILSRITEPTTGFAEIHGQVASLLEVGTGFHPELTGRENIFLNGAILGMKRAEIERKFDEIVAFSEVERFIDTTVKHYSSGMYLRLAFAVAAHLEPEILIVDEVLAVGDAAFQRKCLGKMGDVAKEGRTVFFVSHNMAAISSLCTRALLLDSGRLKVSDTPQSVIEEYLSKTRKDAGVPLSERKDRKGGGKVRFTNASVLNNRGEVVESVVSGQDISISLAYEIPSSEKIDNAIVQIKFAGGLGQQLFACLSRTSSRESIELVPGARLYCNIPRLPLAPGLYTYSIWCKVAGRLEDLVSEAGMLSVSEGDYFGTGIFPARTVGDFLVAHTWSTR
ncbi:MAG: ABC transporter ATP-binding protein [Nitrospira sp.]|nr:MAG: ABC transporter ATP-binding protein [Nitrospira sp.]